MKRRVIALACIAASAACSSTNKEIAIRPLSGGVVDAAAQDALARGDLLFSRGEHALALDAYRRAVRKEPANAHALNGVAISYAAMGRHDLAREFFELALARAPKDERIHRNFARSLAAQGLRSEAEALMAQARGGSVKIAVRPTLAQLASARLQAPIPAPAQFVRSALERVSMGEVRLRTAEGGGGKSLLPGRVTPQLSTAIVTEANEAQAAPVTLARQLTAPIAKKEVAAAPAKKTKTAAAASQGKGCVAKGEDMRLPATGLSIDLPGGRAGNGCSSLAGSERREPSFERLWKWSARLG